MLFCETIITLGIEEDLHGADFNVNQNKIAIGGRYLPAPRRRPRQLRLLVTYVVSAKCLVFAAYHEQGHADEEMDDQVQGGEQDIRTCISTKSHIVNFLNDGWQGLNLIERVVHVL